MSRFGDEIAQHERREITILGEKSFMNKENQASSRPARVVVIGAGFVGSSFAYALLLSGLAAEIVLIDANHARAEGEAMDIGHAAPLSRATRVWAGDYGDCGAADVVVIAAGVNQKPGESRLDLVKRNGDIFGQIIPQIASSGFDGVIVVAANPVDILTYLTQKTSHLPAWRVIGSGTVLDSARLRFEIGRHCGVDANNVHAYIIGEHGDSSQAVWSRVTIGGLALEDYCAAQNIALDEETKDRLFHAARDAAGQIIPRKGATYYAIASALVRIVEAIVRDQNSVLCVSSVVNGFEGIEKVSLSLPSIINRQGLKTVLPLSLTSAEADGLRRSAEVLKTGIASLDLSA